MKKISESALITAPAKSVSKCSIKPKTLGTYPCAKEYWLYWQYPIEPRIQL